MSHPGTWIRSTVQATRLVRASGTGRCERPVLPGGIVRSDVGAVVWSVARWQATLRPRWIVRVATLRGDRTTPDLDDRRRSVVESPHGSVRTVTRCVPSFRIGHDIPRPPGSSRPRDTCSFQVRTLADPVRGFRHVAWLLSYVRVVSVRLATGCPAAGANVDSRDRTRGMDEEERNRL